MSSWLPPILTTGWPEPRMSAGGVAGDDPDEPARDGEVLCEGVRVPGGSERSARSGGEHRYDDAYALVAGEMAADHIDLVPGRRSCSE